MKMRMVLKKLAQNIPYNIGRWTAYAPFQYRLGQNYSRFSKMVQYYENASTDEKHQYLIERLDSIVKHAQTNIPFYQTLYGKAVIQIKSVSDFECLPIITKLQVREYTKETKGTMLVNSGGSSGEPLSFYVDSAAWAREWAHMHYIWKITGYKQTDLMITMLGKNIGNIPYKYNAVHNEFRLNPYINANSIVPEILRLFKHYPVKFFQGYPSTIYNFFKELEPVLNDKEKSMISKSIQSCFFSSELPLPYMVDYLKKVWNLNCISWYGHSEMCVLGYESNNNGIYKPFVTYGYAEECDGTLIGTSFHNYDMPLIRYSTDDLIESTKNKFGIVESFKITSGREGDYIEDNEGKKIPLTSFIFGRHHKIFEIADFLQVSQIEKGKATIYVIFKNEPSMSIALVASYFDLSNIKIDFDFLFLREPIRTQRGKLKLRISQDDIEFKECA